MKFFAPGWMSSNYKRAMKSVGKLKDEDKLHKAALEAPLASVCMAAVEKLRDEVALSNIAKNAPCCDARKCAVKRLIALYTLTDLAEADLEPHAREAVIKNLIDQALLVDAQIMPGIMKLLLKRSKCSPTRVCWQLSRNMPCIAMLQW